MKNIFVNAVVIFAMFSQGASSMDANLSPEEARETAARSVLASTSKILGIPEPMISLHSSFSDQESPADALAFVEIIMAVEEDLGVSINDSALEQFSGVKDPDDLVSHLTVQRLQEFVGSLTLPSNPERAVPSPAKTPNDPLESGDTGPYLQLAARPNPSGYVIIAVPDVDEIISAIKRERGEALTAKEIEEARSAAPSLVMSKDDAEQFLKLRAARSQK